MTKMLTATMIFSFFLLPLVKQMMQHPKGANFHRMMQMPTKFHPCSNLQRLCEKKEERHLYLYILTN
jgi:hypothetical protein